MKETHNLLLHGYYDIWRNICKKKNLFIRWNLAELEIGRSLEESLREGNL